MTSLFQRTDSGTCTLRHSKLIWRNLRIKTWRWKRVEKSQLVIINSRLISSYLTHFCHCLYGSPSSLRLAPTARSSAARSHWSENLDHSADPPTSSFCAQLPVWRWWGNAGQHSGLLTPSPDLAWLSQDQLLPGQKEQMLNEWKYPPLSHCSYKDVPVAISMYLILNKSISAPRMNESVWLWWTDPLGLLQVLIQLLHSLTVFLSQFLDLGLMAPPLFLHGSLQHGHFLLTFRPANHKHKTSGKMVQRPD